MGERDGPPGPQRQQRAMALRAPAVQVHGHVHARRDARNRERRGVQDLVDRAGQTGQRRQLGGRRQHAPVVGKGGRQRAPRGDRREQVAQSERPPHEQRQGGQLDSVAGQTTSSRSSQPAGWLSANSCAAATLAGSFSWASGPGLYFGSRSSKNAVCIPPGTSSVTPTRPAVSAASARVKPTTPNFEAQ